MVVIYNIVLIIICIVLSPLIAVMMIIQPKFRAGFFNKLGFYSFDKKGVKTTVFHAVSVGETNAVKELVKSYRKKHPGEIIVLTTTTATGQEIAKKSLADYADKITYFPFDFFFGVLSFFNTFNPEKVIIAETEIWPCFVSVAKTRGIKVYTVNGRISPHSYDGYKKIKMFLAPVLNRYEKIFMQSEADAQRMIGIGAESEKVEVMGNLKFDISQDVPESEIMRFKNELKTDNYRIFAGASTHKGEDEIVLKAFKELKQKHADAKLLLAPRHPQRYDEVCALLDASGYTWGRRSQSAGFDTCDIILLDTMGELAKLFALCYAAFIGGSFSSTGGHNPLEANIWAIPVISGPCIFNFKDVYKIVTEKNCAVIVNTAEELTSGLLSFYDDERKYKSFCENAKKVFDENRGAVDYVLARI